VSGADELFGREHVERALRYHRPLYLAAAVTVTVNLALLALLTFTVLGDHLYASTSGRPGWTRALIFSLLVVALTRTVGLPLAFWAGYRHEQAWGLSTQSLGDWFLDRLKGFVLDLAFGGSALLGFVGAARAWPAAWPAIVAAVAAATVLALSFLAPVILEPLFHRFRPLADPELFASLELFAERAGVPVERILVADASRRTRKLNAYVSGLGQTRRLVLFDTLLAEASSREAQLVAAHEFGHRRAHHLAKRTVLGMIGATVFVLVVWLLLRWPTLRAAIGASAPGDPKVAPFLLLLGSAVGLLVSPLGAALSRRWERQADAFSLELTHDPETFESTHRRLALTNLADLAPPRLVYLAWSSHPTPPERIAAARALR
jgi:STE24 endopeptidase